MPIQTISGYQFRPSDLNLAGRTSGISAFLRTRNGADFVEATIRSHMPFYDEIVAVYNQCDDKTPQILARLAQEFGPKLRVFHYTDRVQPLGSKGHANTPGDHPESMVNYSNFALKETQHDVVVKLDDDHLAIPGRVAEICSTFRKGTADRRRFHCFSGLNVAYDGQGRLAVPAFELLSGNGDIGYFQIAPDTVFHHDRRFERFDRGRLKRMFAGYFYWHLKFLKSGAGFVNYELQSNPDSRFAKKKVEFDQTAMLDIKQAIAAISPGRMDRVSASTGGKLALNYGRDKAVAAAFPDASLEAALDRLSPDWRQVPGLGSPRG
ncbi:MAG: glycosyl transferase [Proteobacteria bacterium]|nr:glycosyl transferase [Pseudomonadota bacterium]MDA1287115.1 glycosyl transferase [Pseudomonadota bacterium]